MRSAALAPVCFALVSLSGCAWTDHRATLNPMLDVAPSAVGDGHGVQVAVVDERPRDMVGRRGAGGAIGETISLDQDLDEVVRGKLEEGLERNGFAIARGGGQDASSMKVEIRDFEYELVMGMWTGSAQTTAAMKAICRNGNETYERLYRAEHKRGAFFVPTGGKTDRMLDETLSEVLGEVFRDQALLRFLAR